MRLEKNSHTRRTVLAAIRGHDTLEGAAVALRCGAETLRQQFFGRLFGTCRTPEQKLWDKTQSTKRKGEWLT
jgi:hypothetical protein